MVDIQMECCTGPERKETSQREALGSVHKNCRYVRTGTLLHVQRTYRHVQTCHLLLIRIIFALHKCSELESPLLSWSAFYIHMQCLLHYAALSLSCSTINNVKLAISVKSPRVIPGLLIKPKQQRDSLVNFVYAIKDKPAPAINPSQSQREAVAH